MKNNVVIKYTAPPTPTTIPDTIFLQAENVIINKSLEQLTYITLTTPDKSVAVQGSIEYDGQIFEVTEVTKADNGMYDIYAVQDVRELKAALRRSIYYTGVTAATAIQRAMTNNHTADSSDTIASDWQFVAVDNITRKRDIDLDYTTFWDALMEIRDIWHIELEIDTKLKKIKLYGDRSRGKKLSEQTSEFHLYEGVNISGLELSYDGDTFHNIIQGYGQKTTKKTDKDWITYASTKNLKASDGLPARTVYYSSSTTQTSATAVARKWTEADPNSSDPDAKVTMIQKKVNGSWSDANKYYASSRSYDSDGDIVPSTGDQNSIVKTIVTTFTEKKTKIWKTTQTTKLLRASDADSILRDWVFSTYGFEFTGSTIYCYDYTNIKNRAYLYNDKYDDVEALVEDMCLYLRESYQPKASVEITLAQLPTDYRNDIAIGDSVVVHPKEGAKLTMRVLSMQYDVAHPDNTVIELGTRKKSLADSQAMQKRFSSKNTSTTGSLTSAATNNVKSYTNSSNTTEQIVSGSFVSEEELAQVLDLQNSRMTIQNIDASAITTGTLDASIITVDNLDAGSIKTGKLMAGEAEIADLDTGSINGHQIADGSILAAALNNTVITMLGGSKVLYCNWEDMEDYLDPTSAVYTEFKADDTWFELVQEMYTTAEQPNGIWYWDPTQTYTHIKLGATHWIPKPLTHDCIAANAITAANIKAGAITTGCIDAGAVTAIKIASDAITADKIKAGEITADKMSSTYIYTGAIDADQVSAGSFTITGGSINIDTDTTSTDAIKLNYGAISAAMRPGRFYATNGTSSSSINSSRVETPTVITDDIKSKSGGNINVDTGLILQGDVYEYGTTGHAKYSSYNHQHYSDTLYATQVGSVNYKCKVYLQPNSTSSTSAANLRISSSSGAFIDYRSSSRRDVKHDIVPIEQGPEAIQAEKLYDVEVVSFKYNDDYVNKEDCRYGIDMPGFIIDDMMETYPIGVDVEEGIMTNWNEKMLLPPMLKLIQDQKKQLDAQQQQIDALEARLAALEDK